MGIYIFTIPIFLLSICSVIKLAFTQHSNELDGIDQQCDFTFYNQSYYSFIHCGKSNTSSNVTSKFQQFFKNKFLSVSSLTIRESSIESIPQIVGEMVNLVYLDLSNNLIQTLDGGIFEKLNSLRILNLEGNLINKIIDGTLAKEDKLLNLIYISLSKNRLEEIDSWLWRRLLAVNNSYIDLTYNRIATFTNKNNYSCDCHKMYHLNFTADLSYNRIEHIFAFGQLFSNYLPEIFLCNIKQRTSANIKLDENPINCDCNEFKTLRLYLSISYTYPVMTPLKCQNPPNLNNSKVDSVQLDDLICTFSCVSDKCECKQQPSKAAMYVQCSDRKLYELPKILPPRNEPAKVFTKYDLDFSWNSFQNLSAPLYLFNNTRKLNMTHCNLTAITDEFWLAIKNIDFVYLNNNEIKYLPESVKSEEGTFKSLSLNDNLLSCECSNRWLQAWIFKIKDRIDDIDALTCASPNWLKGKSILTVQDAEFCTDPEVEIQRQKLLYIYVVAAIGASVLLAVVTFLIVYKLRVWIFITFKIHPFENDECENELMIFDGFFSSANPDSFMARMIIEFLEELGYKICFHERDFIPGQYVSENISSSINQSKRCIFLLSKNFLASHFCNLEFEIARSRDLKINKNRVIVWLLSDTDELLAAGESMSENLINYLNNYTYINYPKLGWDKASKQLLYAMSRKKLGLEDSELLEDHQLDDLNDLIT